MAEAKEFRLVRCDPAGAPVAPLGQLPEALAANCTASAELYARIGYREPWVSYVAVADGCAIGGGAFVGAPKEGLVEIAYFTLAGEEGRGHASATARELVSIARRAAPEVTIRAYTLPGRNASTRILEKLGFRVFGRATDADAGDVWEWRDR